MPFAFESFYYDRPIMAGRCLDVFRPASVTQAVSLFFIHGGGWRGGGREGFHALMQAANAVGHVCASADYRLTGNIQDQIADVRHGYHLYRAWLGDHHLPERVAVFGSSAGAHLALLLALARPGACGEPLTVGEMTLSAAEWVAPAGVAVQAAPTTFEPWEDMFPPVWEAMRGIVGQPWETAPEAYRRVSPIRHLSANSPPVFLLEAAQEHMFPQAQSRQFIERARSLGVRGEIKTYDPAEHGFLYDVVRRPQREAWSHLLAFFSSLKNG